MLYRFGTQHTNAPSAQMCFPASYAFLNEMRTRPFLVGPNTTYHCRHYRSTVYRAGRRAGKEVFFVDWSNGCVFTMKAMIVLGASSSVEHPQYVSCSPMERYHRLFLPLCGAHHRRLVKFTRMHPCLYTWLPFPVVYILFLLIFVSLYTALDFKQLCTSEAEVITV